MDTRRTMSAPASTLQAGRRITASLATLALVLTVAAPVTFASGDAEAQNRRQSSGQSRQASRQQARPAIAGDPQAPTGMGLQTLLGHRLGGQHVVEQQDQALTTLLLQKLAQAGMGGRAGKGRSRTN